MEIYHYLNSMHRYLMKKGFPYHSVSVIHRQQDLGFHCIFMKSVKDKVTKDVIDVMEGNSSEYYVGVKFGYSFTAHSGMSDSYAA